MKGESKIRVLMDHQTFEKQRFGGISRYFYELASRMKNVETVIPLRFSVNQYLAGSGLADFHIPPVWFYKMMKAHFKRFNLRHVQKVLETTDFDVFHPTYYDPYFLPLMGNRNFVLTIHDMTHERFPQYFSPRDKTPEHKRLLAERATRIIAISENTKRDIVDLLHVNPEKIDVIYHGHDAPTVPLQDHKTLGLPEKYLLYVGERRGYKNFGSTLKAFCQIRQTHPEIHLVLTGKKLSKNERNDMKTLGVSAFVHCFSDVNDHRLAQLYRHAVAFVYPSYYEGFGIPILEAWAQKCPVALAKASCFPEVAEDAAVYFEPENVEEQAEVLLQLIENKELTEKLISRGVERLQLFSWENTARLTEETYYKTLTSKS